MTILGFADTQGEAIRCVYLWVERGAKFRDCPLGKGMNSKPEI